jgi:hypothetical protein
MRTNDRAAPGGDKVLFVGTEKGAFVLRPDADGGSWAVEGPIFKGWKVTAATRTTEGRYLCALASDIYGAALQASDDLVTWRQI